jgi:hypothetical protein
MKKDKQGTSLKCIVIGGLFTIVSALGGVWLDHHLDDKPQQKLSETEMTETKAPDGTFTKTETKVIYK